MKKQISVLGVLIVLLLTACAGGGGGAAGGAGAAPSGGTPAATGESENEGATLDPATDTITIGSLQIADHQSLVDARIGFISGLADEGWIEGENLIFTPFSAQNDVSVANAMAQQIVENRPDLILGIGTSSSQALQNTTETIPIVITAVTDPYSAGLVETLERPGWNITGTSDLSPVADQFELLVRLLPNAQTVGILYNSGEVNSQILAEKAREAARSLGLNYLYATAPSTAYVAQATEFIAGQVDVIYTPTCNTIASAIPVVAAIADDHGVPIIGGNANHVRNGAFATEGIDYYRLGRQAAVMAAQILRGEATPAEMPIQWQDEFNLVINITAAERLGIELTSDVLEVAYIFEEE